MGNKLILLVAIGTWTIAYGCSGGGTTAYSLEDFEYPLESTDVATGQDVYLEYCEGCHPAGEKGDGPKIAGLELSPAKTRWQVRGGGKDMPAFDRDKISDPHLEALLAYTATMNVNTR